MKRLDVTPAIVAQLEAVRFAAQTHQPGRDPLSLIEIPKLALADAVLAELEAARLARLPRRADGGMVPLRLPRTRRKSG